MVEKIKLCASCRRSEIEADADYLVKGRVNERPYRGLLCEEHAVMYLMDEGNELDIVEYVSEKAKNELAQELTAYRTFDKLCDNNVTLRYHPSDSKEFKRKIELLRKYYRQRTGKQAYK